MSIINDNALSTLRKETVDLFRKLMIKVYQVYMMIKNSELKGNKVMHNTNLQIIQVENFNRLFQSYDYTLISSPRLNDMQGGSNSLK